MLSFASIASGSNGNCYYIGNDNEAVLIDAGISCRETERRMLQLQLDIRRVRAIFISHEHSDHISGLEVLSRKYCLPVYINEKTLRNSQLKLAEERVQSFITGNDTPVGQLKVHSFAKSHDAADPQSFLVSQDGFHIGIFTDIGHASAEVKEHLKACHAIFLETNYCEQMLAESFYPESLKRRIGGRKGHLSNREALELLQKHAGRHLRQVILSHLSANNNHPDRVAREFESLAPLYQLHIASRHHPSPLFHLDTSGGPFLFPGNGQERQLRLF